MALIENQGINFLENQDKLKERDADNDAYAEECVSAEEEGKMEESQKGGREIFGSYNPDLIAEMNAQILAEECGEKNYVMEVEDSPEKEENSGSETDNYVMDTNENNEAEELNTFKENPNAPLLDGLLKAGHINIETYNNTVEKLLNCEKNEENEIIKIVVNNINNKDAKKQILEHLDGNKEDINIETFEKSEFYTNSKELNIDIDAGIGGLELMLANEFYIMPDNAGNSNQKLDILRTMDKVSKIITVKNNNDFRLNNSDLIAEISGEKNPSKKYTMLKELFKEDLATDATFGGSRAKAEIAMKQKSIKAKAKDNTDAQEQMITSSNKELGEQKNNELTEEKSKLIAEANNLDRFEGEIFSGGKNEIANKGSEKIKEATA